MRDEELQRNVSQVHPPRVLSLHQRTSPDLTFGHGVELQTEISSVFKIFQVNKNSRNASLPARGYDIRPYSYLKIKKIKFVSDENKS